MRRVALAAILTLGLAACGGGSDGGAVTDCITRHNAIVDEMDAIVQWQDHQLEQYDVPYSDALPAEVKAEWDRKMDQWDQLNIKLQTVDEMNTAGKECA